MTAGGPLWSQSQRPGSHRMRNPTRSCEAGGGHMMAVRGQARRGQDAASHTGGSAAQLDRTARMPGLRQLWIQHLPQVSRSPCVLRRNLSSSAHPCVLPGSGAISVVTALHPDRRPQQCSTDSAH
ncbi:hypothetical protein GDO78_021357 [Eleutherodactylus coqui]|uniref:Uncharacterized protein n=1 Tax=Eleutherodactylus coqui TaxID=57060 RepID=A0A8J6BJ00_ELECQ|nr:hypothetical protein GDO78_021357 [Eleutherodactylus coqui]